MKKVAPLAVACAIIWFCVASLFLIIGLEFYNSSKKQEKTPVQITVNGDNNTINYIDGNSNEVISMPMGTPLSEEEILLSTWASKIVTIRAIKYGCDWFTFEDGLWLAEKIIHYAKEEGLTPSQAFIICYVESDFKETAYNRGGQAYGLTQVTQPCLDEYNWMNGTNYTLNDMLKADLNLKVGFWYYHRLLTHYKNYPEYGIKDLKDAYIAYNIGVTKFMKVGNWGRNQLRNGFYPCAMYGNAAGDSYTPAKRYDKIVSTI